MDTLKQALDDLKGKRVKYYTILNYTLDVARANEPLFIAGAYIYVLNLDGTAKVKLNEISGDDIDLFKYRQIASPFYRIFLTHTAQALKVLSLAIGIGAENFSISDFQSPDLSLLSGYGLELRNTFAYNYGTQIAKSNSISGGTVIVHTVTSGKTFLLEFAQLQVYTGVASGTENKLIVRNAADVEQYRILSFIMGDTSQDSEVFRGVLSIPEGWDICLFSPTGNDYGRANIKGREV
jgi:hypothetical protein